MTSMKMRNDRCFMLFFCLFQFFIIFLANQWEQLYLGKRRVDLISSHRVGVQTPQ